MSQEELAAFAQARTGNMNSAWLSGEIGVFLSHQGIWKVIAKGVDGAAAIFEDDLTLASDLRLLLKSDEWIPTDADLVRLEANRKLLLRDGRAISGVPGRRLFRAESGTWGAAGYIITRNAARRLVDTDPSLHCPVDNFLFKPGRSAVADILRRYQVVPAVCVQTQLLLGRAAAPESLIGSEGRKPRAISTTRLNLARLLPWKKRPVLFKP
jgi:glycosyl transferase family 25